MNRRLSMAVRLGGACVKKGDFERVNDERRLHNKIRYAIIDECIDEDGFEKVIAKFKDLISHYASVIDKAYGRKNGNALRSIMRMLEDDAGIPIHNITTEYPIAGLQEALARLEATINQTFEINADDVITIIENNVKALKKLSKNNKRSHFTPKIIGKATPGFLHRSRWNRTRSNPKLR